MILLLRYLYHNPQNVLKIKYSHINPKYNLNPVDYRLIIFSLASGLVNEIN